MVSGSWFLVSLVQGLGWLVSADILVRLVFVEDPCGPVRFRVQGLVPFGFLLLRTERAVGTHLGNVPITTSTL